MRQRFLVLLLALLPGFFPGPLQGASTASPGFLPRTVPASANDLPDVDKFLFIVSISESMEKLTLHGRQTLYELIQSGIYGHMRDGDTFGVWTYNDQVQAGVYPMQVWVTNKVITLATQASKFVEDGEYDNRPRLDRVLEKVAPVAKAVKNLNVIIINDGYGKIKGTPFDTSINKLYKQRSRQVKKAQQPLITTLVVRGGVIVTASVNMTGELINLPVRPELKPDLKDVEANSATAKRRKRPAGDPGRVIVINKDTIAASAGSPNPTPEPVVAGQPGSPSPAPNGVPSVQVSVQTITTPESEEPRIPWNNNVLPAATPPGQPIQTNAPVTTNRAASVSPAITNPPAPIVSPTSIPPTNVVAPSAKNAATTTDAPASTPAATVVTAREGPVTAQPETGHPVARGVQETNSAAVGQLGTTATGTAIQPQGPTLWLYLGGGGLVILVLALLVGYWMGSRSIAGPSFITRSILRK